MQRMDKILSMIITLQVLGLSYLECQKLFFYPEYDMGTSSTYVTISRPLLSGIKGLYTNLQWHAHVNNDHMV